ncbi:glycosyl transferase, group 1 [Marinomonas sp. MED121]|nr:glycosyl transferase, group 1 [Marinomonas sp. MED121]
MLTKYFQRSTVLLFSKSLYKAQVFTIIYNEITERNDKLHDINTYSGYGSNYRLALNGFDKSRTGRSIKKIANKTFKKRKKQLDTGFCEGVLFATRSWHFLEPLLQYYETNNLKYYRYDVNAYDTKYFQQNKVNNKAKYHREYSFSSMKKMFRVGFDPGLESNIYLDSPSIKEIEKADVIFVDWLNHNAFWALDTLPTNKKIIIRVHSYEVFSFFPCVINFGRVDGLIFISHGIKEVFLELWGWMLPKGILIDVIDNIRLPRKELTIDQSGNLNRSKTIGMMQYAQSVKGFRFALNVFKKIYQIDNSYRFLLCGHKLSEISSSENELLTKEINDFPSGVIIELGYINDVREYFEKVGFILSTSEREGSHESIIQGMSYGCIPIIRNWPLLSPFNAAQKAFPMCNIIESEDEAVKKIFTDNSAFCELSERYKTASDVYFNSIIPEKYLAFINKVKKNEKN